MKASEKKETGIRHIGDEGREFDMFNGLDVIIETDPNGVVESGDTVLKGTIYKGYFNLKDRTGLICVNIHVGQKYHSKKTGVIDQPFALFVEPHQVIGINSEILGGGCLLTWIEARLIT